MSLAVNLIASIASSNVTLCSPSPANANCAAVTALTDPRAFLSIQGIATKPSIGSQVNPNECSLLSPLFRQRSSGIEKDRERTRGTNIPISAACRICSMDPPIQAVNAAAAIEVETPTSAIHLSIGNTLPHQWERFGEMRR